MAVGGLSTLAFHPVRLRVPELESRPQSRRSELAGWLSGLSLAGLGRPLTTHPVWEGEATCAAHSWLQLVDDEQHPASWAAAAGLLREEIGSREWDAALRAVRAPLGRCLWRTLRSRTVVEGPPGPLRGPYVVIRFDSEFERGGAVGETITPVLGPDGRWRVAAYFIA
jgi:serine/threonine-protein kinase